jgi:hypothetical protein
MQSRIAHHTDFIFMNRPPFVFRFPYNFTVTEGASDGAGAPFGCAA